MPDVRAWRRVHFVGIGGAGMKGIARILLARGVEVSGSDLKDAGGLAALREAGAVVSIGHRAVQVGQPDAVVVSSAIPRGNVEVRQAHAAGIPVVTRAQALAGLTRGMRTVAVAGTHGKTTTTSMISVMLTRIGLDPTYIIGGDLNESGSGAGYGASDLFVAEADESDGSFLLLDPEIAVITNVEEDHLDFYAGRAEVEAAFAAFARRARGVICCWDDAGVRRSVDGAPVHLIRYGGDAGSDIRIRDRAFTADGVRGTIEVFGAPVDVVLSVPGGHNLLNAAAAIGVAGLLDIPLTDAAEALRSFSGVRRRFERRGVVAETTFIDDYAHHPTEVAATLETARVDGWGRIVAVFQPHRYSRTRAMWRALGRSLMAADVVVLTDVYGAGERPIPGVTGKLVVEALTEEAPGKRVIYLPRRSEVAPFLAGEVRPGDLVLTLGAGDVTMVATETLERIRETGR